MSRFAIMMVALLMLTACHKATYLTADTDTIEVPRQGATDSLRLHSDAGDFEIISADEWIKATMDDSTLIVKIGPNKDKSPRGGNVVIGNGDQRLSLRVAQGASATYMTLGETSVTIPRDGSAVELEVKTDGSDVRIEGVEGVKSTYSGGKLKLTGAGNDGKTRKTTARVVCDTISRTLTVVETGTVCGRCGGSGTVTCRICRGSGVDYCPYRPCDLCHGRGKSRCPECNGKGK